MDAKGPMPALHPEVLDVAGQRLGEAKAVERQKRGQAWSRAEERPAWTKKAPSPLRSSPTAWDS